MGWTWGSGATDGGAFPGLGETFDVVVDPAFNDDAALYREYYEGILPDWTFVSGPLEVVDRYSLSLSDPPTLSGPVSVTPARTTTRRRMTTRKARLKRGRPTPSVIDRRGTSKTQDDSGRQQVWATGTSRSQRIDRCV